MKSINTTAEEILKPLKMVEGIVEKRQTLPILSNLLIQQNDTAVKFSSTDLDIQISTSTNLGAPGAGEIEYTVAAGKLASIIGALNAKDPVSLEFEKDTLTVSSGRRVYKLKTLPAADYPILKTNPWHTDLTVEARALRYLLTMTSFAMANQDVRYFLNGVLLVVDHRAVRAVATDTHRLACCDLALEEDSGKNIEAILPRKTVRELIRILPEDETPVKLHFSDTQVCFEFDDVLFMSKLVEGKFPDYRRVIPSKDSNPHLITLNREELIGSLRRVNIMTSEKFNGVRWILNNNELKIQSVNNDVEGADETLNIEWTHDVLDMGFNITYLVEVLTNLKNKDVNFSFASASGSVLITMPNDEDRFRYVVMPMRL